MGSEKYPDQSEYMKFIGEKGGWSNAFTSLFDTNYHFECGKEGFYEALDRFAQFYVSPLLKEDCVDKEMNAVNSESELYLNNDSWRLFHLSRTFADENTEFNKYNVGNLDTLKKDGVVEALKDFHSKYYSSNQMGLVVYAPEELDQIQKKVEEIFDPVPNKKIKYETWKELPFPFSSKIFGKLARIVPVKDLDKMTISFAFDGKYYNSRKNKSLNYLSHLIGHESKGSILHLLAEEGLATSLSAGGEHTEDYFTSFEINVNLTQKGLKEWHKVFAVVGAYIKMLREEGPQQWVYEECSKLGDLRFRFFKKREGSDMAVSLSRKLVSDRDPLNVLKSGYVFGDFDAEEIKEITANLDAEHVHIDLISKSFENEAKEEEPIYGTKFSLEDIKEETMTAFKEGDISWATCGEKICLPDKNTFIPTEFDLYPAKEEEEQVRAVREEESSVVYFQQDKNFKLPEVAASVRVYTKSGSYQYSDVKLIVLSLVFNRILDDQLRSFNYMASMAGITVSIDVETDSVTFDVKCYSQSLKPFLQQFVQNFAEILQFENETKFDDQLYQLQKQLKNSEKNPPFRRAFSQLQKILNSEGVSSERILAESEKISFEDFKNFLKDFFSEIRFEWLIEGNYTEELGIEVSKSFESEFLKKFNSKILSKENVYQQRVVKIKSNSAWIVEEEIPIAEEKNSAFMRSYEVEQGTAKDGFLIFLTAYLKDKYFEELRTEQQLGYVVFASRRELRGVRNFIFLIQSDHKSTHYCWERTKEFLDKYLSKMKEMEDEEFENLRKGALAIVTEKYKNLMEKFRQDLNQIRSREYDWDHKKTKENQLNALDKAGVAAEFEKIFFSDVRAVELHYYAPEKKQESVKERDARVEKEEGLSFGESWEKFRNENEKFEDKYAKL